MQKKRYFLYELALLLLLPFVFTTPVPESDSDDLSEDSRFFLPFFSSKFNKTDSTFGFHSRPFAFDKGGDREDEDEADTLESEDDSLDESRFFSFFSHSRYNSTGRPFNFRPRPFSFGSKNKGRGRKDDDERDLSDFEDDDLSDDLSDDERFFSFFSHSRYNSTGRPFSFRPRPFSFGSKNKGRGRDDDDERDLSDFEEDDLSDEARFFSLFSNSLYNSSDRPSSGNSRPSFSFFDFLKQGREGEERGSFSSSRKGQSSSKQSSTSSSFNTNSNTNIDTNSNTNSNGFNTNNNNAFTFPTLQAFGSNQRSLDETDKTKREIPCPTTPSCRNWANNRYRSPDGICNNLRAPLSGSTGIPFNRYLPNAYDDGISIPRGDLFNNLPSPRQVSAAISNAGNPGPLQAVSLMVMQWGQFIDHDLALTPEFEDDHCCEEGIALQSSEPECRELDVTGDPFYDSFGVQCLHFTRSEFAVGSCVSGQAREQVNNLTAYLDGSQVYGSTQQDQDDLRLFFGGQLRTGFNEEQFSGSCPSICPFTFLPTRIDEEGEEEFFAGDIRAQEQPGLTSIHTLFVRVHNSIATLLQSSSRRSDENIFQEARRIVSALIQQITYNEFLPLILGSVPSSQFDIFPRSSGYISYNSNIDASTVNVFATAAFRFGHSLIKNAFTLDSVPVPLAESFGDLHLTMTRGRYPSDFLKALCSETADGMDYFMVETLTNRLFADEPSFRNGSDLMARNIMRGREHGIAPYNRWRELCGLRVARSFEDLLAFMPRQAVEAFRSVYASVDDIDLFPAGIAEFPFIQGDGLLGPTFACLIGNYFNSLKFGDRYFYENSAQPSRFSSSQLNAIRRIRLSTLICAYTNTQQIRPWAMLLDVQGNNLRSCASILQESIPDLRRIVF